MPLERLVLLIVCVLAAAALTIWIGGLLVSAWALPWPATLAVGSLTALVLYIVGRAILERIGNAEDDHYDGMNH